MTRNILESLCRLYRYRSMLANSQSYIVGLSIYISLLINISLYYRNNYKITVQRRDMERHDWKIARDVATNSTQIERIQNDLVKLNHSFD